MTTHKPPTAEELAEIQRLLKVANGTADHEYWSGEDEPNDFPPPLSPADAAEADRLAKIAEAQK